MRVDIESLGTFSRTAHEGAERAARNLTGMTGIETAVDVTGVSLCSADALARDDRERIGVVVEFEGAVTGQSVLSFPPEGVETLLDALLPGAELRDSAIREVGNVVTSGFVDAWADHLETTIDLSPPSRIDGTPADLFDAVGFERDRAVVFRSRASAVGERLDFEFHMFPDPDSLAAMLADGGGEIPVEKLTALREVARAGARTASESVSAMTGIDTTVDVSHLSFVPIEDVPAELSGREHVGVVLEFEGAPGGYMMILFDEPSAREVVAALVPGVEEVESFDGMNRSAIQEIGNVMTSSFVDGWANVLDATIDISTPQFVHDMGRAVADSVVARLGQRQSFAFLFDATLRADDRSFDCQLYAIPDETELRSVLADLDPDATAERTTKAGSL
ncbi:chemotaxis protein CheC [Halorussus salilacus]|uniref:chemotaxis protein CheC n=1 Tax=Halorussus salilacus TaxID=2953750 RepID=UPI00209C9FCC|nr:chemotaxis protein CheC [Halorussus salilacus]USZ68130.1 chemotaxis protein CheC [Halorussus salilacus]